MAVNLVEHACIVSFVAVGDHAGEMIGCVCSFFSSKNRRGGVELGDCIF